MDEFALETRARFFSHSKCANCSSTENLELDRVNPLEYQTEDIWSWAEFKRDREIKNECQVLCSPCYLRKKRMWKRFRLANEDWYQKFKASDEHLKRIIRGVN